MRQPQHLQALAHANEIRIARGKLKRRVAAGELTVAQVLSDPPVEVETMPILTLLMAQHRWAAHRARIFLRHLSISETRTVRNLTARERGRITDALEHGADEFNGGFMYTRAAA